ncbi:hypothetical protein [Nocardia transvalensis]|uniref:hypothetical protein n=1 Tax=Nocardia transvalensis TaxID=37333 RepID=UPI0018947021|nr:hypothetical protein [Nocardia transvalensis]MBF6333526.1 hypothetical protein [Nocardia transvalensis]
MTRKLRGVHPPADSRPIGTPVLFNGRRVRRDGPGTVPITDARAHLGGQQKSGRTLDDLAALTALPRPVLSVVLRHDSSNVDAEVARRILAIPVGPLPATETAPALGAQRRLRALAAMGHPPAALATAMKVPEQTVTGLLAALPESRTIPAALWRAIDATYDELSMTVGPDSALRDRARTDGWVPPLGWDDEEIDDPRARAHSPRAALGIDEVAIIRRVCNDHRVNLSPGEVDLILDLAARSRWSIQRLADVLGSSVETADQRLRRYVKRSGLKQQETITKYLGLARNSSGVCPDCHKCVYATEQDARRAARGLTSEQDRQYAYPCPVTAGSWHTGGRLAAARAAALQPPAAVPGRPVEAATTNWLGPARNSSDVCPACHKYAYATEDAARRATRSLRSMHAYPCPVTAGMWHTGGRLAAARVTVTQPAAAPVIELSRSRTAVSLGTVA